MTVQDPLLQDNGYEQITGLSTVKTLTVPANTVSALVQVDVSDVRYLMNGSNPTANVGNSMGVGDRIKFNAVEAASLKFIEVDSGAILDVQYEKAV